MIDIIDISRLFQRTFGNRPYVIGSDGQITHDPGPGYRIPAAGSVAEQQFTATGSLLREEYLGRSILLPVSFYDESGLLLKLPYSVVSVSSQKTLIQTPLAQRRGTVKELYAIDDYVINIKGFVISEDRRFPEAELQQLRSLYEMNKAVMIENALTNIFLTDADLPESNRRVAIKNLDLPEVMGGREHARPFSMQVLSDTVFVLEVDE